MEDIFPLFIVDSMKFQANSLNKLLLLTTINLTGILAIQAVNILKAPLYLMLLAYVFEIGLLMYLVIMITRKTYLKVILENKLILKELTKVHELDFNSIEVELKGLLLKKIVIKFENKKYRLYQIDYFNIKQIYNEIERRIV